MRLQKVLEVGLVLLWSAGLTFLAYLAHGKRFGIDDAYIFFTYASNLASGRGLTYSEGIPEVEGYTSTLWMLLSSAVFFLGWGEFGVLVLAVLCFAATHLILLGLIRQLAKQSHQTALILFYVAIVSSSFAYVAWTTVSLMDTTIWGLLLALLLRFSILSSHSWAGRSLAIAAASLAPLARPEAVLIVPVILTAVIALRWKRGQKMADVWPMLFGFGAATVALTVFRLSYFGHPLPNTFYAKVSPSLTYNLEEGSAYLFDYLLSNPVVNFSFFAAITVVVMSVVSFVTTGSANGDQHSSTLQPATSVVAIMVVLLTLVPVVSGGDHFQLFRFFQPGFPLVALLTTLFLGAILSRLDWRPPVLSRPGGRAQSLTFAAGVLGWLAVFSTTDTWLEVRANTSPIYHEFAIAVAGKESGKTWTHLFESRRSESMPSIGVITAGGTAFAYEGPVYDLMGLNNEFIAHFPGERVGFKNHAAFEKEAFFQLPVDMLAIAPGGFANSVLKGLLEDPRFVDEWRYGVVSSNSGLKESFEGFVATRFLAEIQAEKDFSFAEKRFFDPATATWVSAPTTAPSDLP